MRSTEKPTSARCWTTNTARHTPLHAEARARVRSARGVFCLNCTNPHRRRQVGSHVYDAIGALHDATFLSDGPLEWNSFLS